MKVVLVTIPGSSCRDSRMSTCHLSSYAWMSHSLKSPYTRPGDLRDYGWGPNTTEQCAECRSDTSRTDLIHQCCFQPL